MSGETVYVPGPPEDPIEVDVAPAFATAHATLSRHSPSGMVDARAVAVLAGSILTAQAILALEHTIRRSR